MCEQSRSSRWCASTRNDEFFHATLWRKGVIGDLGALDGDCFSVAGGINSNDQIQADESDAEE